MKFIIKHESRGRMRVPLCQSRMTLAQADPLPAWLHALFPLEAYAMKFIIKHESWAECGCSCASPA